MPSETNRDDEQDPFDLLAPIARRNDSARDAQEASKTKSSKSSDAHGTVESDRHASPRARPERATERAVDVEDVLVRVRALESVAREGFADLLEKLEALTGQVASLTERVETLAGAREEASEEAAREEDGSCSEEEYYEEYSAPPPRRHGGFGPPPHGPPPRGPPPHGPPPHGPPPHGPPPHGPPPHGPPPHGPPPRDHRQHPLPHQGPPHGGPPPHDPRSPPPTRRGPPVYEPPAYEPPAYEPPAYEPPAYEPPRNVPFATDPRAYPTYAPPPPEPPRSMPPPPATSGAVQTSLEHMIADFANMGFTRAQVLNVVSEMASSGQKIEVNSVLDRLMRSN